MNNMKFAKFLWVTILFIMALLCFVKTHAGNSSASEAGPFIEVKNLTMEIKRMTQEIKEEYKKLPLLTALNPNATISQYIPEGTDEKAILEALKNNGYGKPGQYIINGDC